MADHQMEPEDPALAIAARHALHDEELIAAFATDGDAAADPARASGLIERCVACHDLHADIAAIGGVLRASGKAEAVARTLSAPRDFRLSVETANRLRPGSVALRFRDRMAAAVASFSRPVGLSMASLGVVGLLLGTLTLTGSAGPELTPADNGGNGPAAGPTQGVGEITGPAGTTLATMRASSGALATTAPPTAAPPTAAPPSADTGEVPGPVVRGGSTVSTLLFVGSAALLIVGIALLFLGSRRREPIPSR